MKQIILAASGLLLVFITVPSTRAQVTIDVSKITCDEFIKYKVTRPENIAIWLSGFYHGKRNDMLVDTQELSAKTKKVKEYCFQNREALIMQAVETVLQIDK